MAAVAEPLCTAIESVDEIKKHEALFTAFVRGETVDQIAVRLALPYIEVANAVQRRLAALGFERDNLPEVEDARLQFAREKLLPAVEAGDVPSIKEWRNIGESRRRLYDADKKPDVKSGPTLQITFAFGPESRVRVAEAVAGPAENDLRPTSYSVDRDGDEDGKDSSGVDLDRRGSGEG